MKALISLIRKVRDAAYLLAGIAVYFFSKHKLQIAYQALIRLFPPNRRQFPETQ